VRCRPGSIALVAGLLVVALAACSGGGESATAPTSTTPGSTTIAPAPTPGATDGACAPFRGVTTSLRSVGPTSPAFLVDATAGADGCLDRVTFTFEPATAAEPPGYEVGYRDAAREPFVDGDPPVPIEVPGAAHLVVTIKPAWSTNPLVEGRPQTYTGNLSLEYGDHHHLQIVRKLPDGANTVQWVIGLDGPRPFIVDRATDPPRISIYIG
jgi:hypothetical protein